ncbi:hypothetical protein I546_1720 [Mycobacterium kansasii 732]|nr:hypothetical protein I546_1720 [Mycobacterium kansasii 732]
MQLSRFGHSETTVTTVQPAPTTDSEPLAPPIRQLASA